MRQNLIAITLCLGLIGVSCATTGSGSGNLSKKTPRYQVCLGVRKTGLTATKFAKSVESHLRFFNLPEAWPEQLDSVFVAIENPSARLGKLSDQYSLAIYRDDIVNSEFKDEVFPPLSPQIFNPLRSHCEKAELMNSALDALLKPGSLVDVFGEPIDWKKGTTRLLIGTRPSSVKSADFLWSVTRHVQSKALALKDLGLKGFLVYSSENHVVAFLNWAEDSKPVDNDFQGVVEETLSSEAETFSGKIEPSHFYKIRRPTLTNK